MVRSAPRYDPRIELFVVWMDDEGESMAEICRRVATAAEALGLTRPSLVHLRTLVRAERDRKEYERARSEELRELGLDVVGTFVAGRVPEAYWVRERIL